MSVPLSSQQSNVASLPPTKTSESQKGKPSTASQVQQSKPTPTPASTVKSKKDSSKTSTPSAMQSKIDPKDQSQGAVKKVSRRSSKPIINWFQRKLAGTVRARRVSETQRYNTVPTRSGKDSKHRRSSAPMPPPLTIQSRTRSITAGSRQNRSHSHLPGSRRGTLSLNESTDGADSTSYASGSDDDLASSLARGSAYSPASYMEADDDASVRPLPPSSPPSPSPSRSSSSYLSHSRTFRSMAASTKPTTLLSVDLTGGMAHIAQAPPTPTTPGHRIPPHIRTHSSGPSVGSITFSAIPPPSPTSASRPSSGQSGAVGSRGATLTAPLYTSHHPRNNPRPSSPPPDDASVLTLASSAFGMPGARFGAAAVALSGRGSIADDSVSQWSHAAGLTDSTSHFMMGELEEGTEEERYPYHDVDASVRALRPRSSRRGSWDSTASGWSANVGVSAPSPGGIKSKGLWRSGSFRTGGLSTENEEALEDIGTRTERDKDTVPSQSPIHDAASQSSATEEGGETTTMGEVSEATEDAKTPPSVVSRDASSTMTLPGSKASILDDLASTRTLPGSKAMSEVVSSPDNASSSAAHSGTSTPTKGESATLGDDAAKSDEVATNRFSAQLSPTSTEAHTVYHSAPSTPMVP
ncbi:hypothetical protein BN946_scf185043.g113 [Trametes cinnabarina]|uniref:Uncharacterized protein n=1 Tax=Pycnoporus cinnabarinus TaxID=5643 RepID=A0A060SNN7_PYCCI|nr:hypothetical protein BN946_scf185043.g113 [Trametes cinnabarina]